MEPVVIRLGPGPAARSRYEVAGHPADEVGRVAEAIERLTARIEAAEQRSTLAITGIDQSVRGALSRLETAEREQVAVAARFEGAVDETQHPVRRRRRTAASSWSWNPPARARPRPCAPSRACSARSPARSTRARARTRETLASPSRRAWRPSKARRNAFGDRSGPAGRGGRRAGRGGREPHDRRPARPRRLVRRAGPPPAHRRERQGRWRRTAGGPRRRPDPAHGSDPRRDGREPAAPPPTGRFDRMERKLSEMAAHIQTAETRSAQAIERMGREVVSMADSLSRRVQTVENHGADAIEQIGGEVARIATVVEQKLNRADGVQAQALEKARRRDRPDHRAPGRADRQLRAARRPGHRRGRRAGRPRHRTHQPAPGALLRRPRRAHPPERGAHRPPAGRGAREDRPEPERLAPPAVRAGRPESRPGGRGGHARAGGSAGTDIAPRAVRRSVRVPSPSRLAGTHDPGGGLRAPGPDPSGGQRAPPLVEPEPFPVAERGPPPFSEEDFEAADGFAPIAEDVDIPDAPVIPAAPEISPFDDRGHAGARARPARCSNRPAAAARWPARAGGQARRRPRSAACSAPDRRSPSVAPDRPCSRPSCWRPARAPESAMTQRRRRHGLPAAATARKVADRVAEALQNRRADATGRDQDRRGRHHADAAGPMLGEPKVAVAIGPQGLAPAGPTSDPALGRRARRPPTETPRRAAESPGQPLRGRRAPHRGARPDRRDRCLKRAANLGYAPAQFYLAKLYENGEGGLRKDPVEARRWTERAAQGGDRKAMHNLGLYYLRRPGRVQEHHHRRPVVPQGRRSRSVGQPVQSRPPLRGRLRRQPERRRGLQVVPDRRPRRRHRGPKASAERVKKDLSPEARTASERIGARLPVGADGRRVAPTCAGDRLGGTAARATSPRPRRRCRPSATIAVRRTASPPRA
jgi:localization factor PodJL